MDPVLGLFINNLCQNNIYSCQKASEKHMCSPKSNPNDALVRLWLTLGETVAPKNFKMANNLRLLVSFNGFFTTWVTMLDPIGL